MSLIRLLTATEKQVHLGRLHMRPIQWHLKQNWQVPESLEKVIPVPRLHQPHLEWWQIGYSQSLTHFRWAECSRQAIQARPDISYRIQARPYISYRVVSPSKDLPGNMQGGINLK